MKKALVKNPIVESDDMRAEYDFASMKGAVRGKYSKASREGHTVRVIREDGSVDVRHYKGEDEAFVIDRDVREYFPTAEDVNNTLRGLIALLPAKQQKRVTRKRQTLKVQP